MKYLNKITPTYDKLKHFFIGTLAFIGLSMFFRKWNDNSSYQESVWLALLILLIGVSFWEVAQKLRKGKNNLKESLLDILFSILSGSLITLETTFL